MKNGSAPAAETSPSTVRTASSDAVTDGETHHVAPTKRSASAPSMLCVLPAMGCVPMKCTSRGRISAAHFRTCALVEPVSVDDRAWLEVRDKILHHVAHAVDGGRKHDDIGLASRLGKIPSALCRRRRVFPRRAGGRDWDRSR